MAGRALAALAAVLFSAAAFSWTATQAQELSPPSSMILTLDQERLFNGSRHAEMIQAEIERRSADLAAENRRIEADLAAEELELTERRPELPVDEFRALADAFDAKVQSIRVAQDAKARELQRYRDEERQLFLRRISPVLAEIVRERGAVIVLDRRSVLLSAEAIDVTDQAIARINAAFDAERAAEDTAETPEEDGADPAADNGADADPDAGEEN